MNNCTPVEKRENALYNVAKEQEISTSTELTNLATLRTVRKEGCPRECWPDSAAACTKEVGGSAPAGPLHALRNHRELQSERMDRIEGEIWAINKLTVLEREAGARGFVLRSGRLFL